MQTIIAQPALVTHQVPAIDRQRRADRLARASADQMQTALAFLNMIDPEAFDIAFTAVPHPVTEAGEDDQAEPLCITCGTPVGIFPDLGPDWRHYRGDRAAAGRHEVYDPGHVPEVAWYAPDDMPEYF